MFALVLFAQLFDEANAQGLTTYSESSGTGLKPRSNAGVAVQTDKLRMRADFALRAQPIATAPLGLAPMGASTEVTPNLRSALTIAKNLDIETRVNFAEWNARSDTTFDTGLRYRKSLDFFFDELDGNLWRSPDGLTKQSLRLGFKQRLGDFGGTSPLTITGKATFETTQNAAAAGLSSDSRKVGIETSCRLHFGVPGGRPRADLQGRKDVRRAAGERERCDLRPIVDDEPDDQARLQLAVPTSVLQSRKRLRAFHRLELAQPVLNGLPMAQL